MKHEIQKMKLQARNMKHKTTNTKHENQKMKLKATNMKHETANMKRNHENVCNFSLLLFYVSCFMFQVSGFMFTVSCFDFHVSYMLKSVLVRLELYTRVNACTL
jgi:hypothetical protein